MLRKAGPLKPVKGREGLSSLGMDPAHARVAYALNLMLDVRDDELVVALLLPEHIQLQLKLLEKIARLNIIILLEDAVLLLQPAEHAVVLLHL